MLKPFQTPAFSERCDCLAGLPVHALCHCLATALGIREAICQPSAQGGEFPKWTGDNSKALQLSECNHKPCQQLAQQPGCSRRKAGAQLFMDLTHRSAVSVRLGDSPHPWHAEPAPLSCCTQETSVLQGKNSFHRVSEIAITNRWQHLTSHLFHIAYWFGLCLQTLQKSSYL